MSEWRSFPYWVGQMTVRVMFVAGWELIRREEREAA